MELMRDREGRYSVELNVGRQKRRLLVTADRTGVWLRRDRAQDTSICGGEVHVGSELVIDGQRCAINDDTRGLLPALCRTAYRAVDVDDRRWLRLSGIGATMDEWGPVLHRVAEGRTVIGGRDVAVRLFEGEWRSSGPYRDVTSTEYDGYLGVGGGPGNLLDWTGAISWQGGKLQHSEGSWEGNHTPLRWLQGRALTVMDADLELCGVSIRTPTRALLAVALAPEREGLYLPMMSAWPLAVAILEKIEGVACEEQHEIHPCRATNNGIKLPTIALKLGKWNIPLDLEKLRREDGTILVGPSYSPLAIEMLGSFYDGAGDKITLSKDQAQFVLADRLYPLGGAGFERGSFVEPTPIAEPVVIGNSIMPSFQLDLTGAALGWRPLDLSEAWDAGAWCPVLTGCGPGARADWRSLLQECAPSDCLRDFVMYHSESGECSASAHTYLIGGLMGMLLLLTVVKHSYLRSIWKWKAE